MAPCPPNELRPVPVQQVSGMCPSVRPKPPARCASGGTAGSAGRPRRSDKGQAWLAAVVLGAAVPVGGGEPLTCGAVGAGSCVPSGVGPAESDQAALSVRGRNGKTGPIAVSSTSLLPCPCSCPMAGGRGCDAEAGFRTRLHWDRLSRGQGGATAAAFIRQVAALPADILFRHCVADDQWPDQADPLHIDQALLLQLPRASRQLRRTEGRQSNGSRSPPAQQENNQHRQELRHQRIDRRTAASPRHPSCSPELSPLWRLRHCSTNHPS
jgi:hypothetical protein